MYSTSSSVSDADCRKVTMDNKELTIQSANCSNGEVSGSAVNFPVNSSMAANNINITNVKISLAPTGSTTKYDGEWKSDQELVCF